MKSQNSLADLRIFIVKRKYALNNEEGFADRARADVVKKCEGNCKSGDEACAKLMATFIDIYNHPQ